MDVNNYNKYRIKLRYPDGLEFEVEGTKEFVVEQKNEILSLAGRIKDAKKRDNISETISKIIDFKSNIPYIKIRLPELDQEMAFLIILCGYKLLQNLSEVSAISLSKALKLSGYSPKRLDRIARELIKDKSIDSYGSKRSRSYSITERGLTKAAIKLFNISEK
ncbi:MAG: hypothetical protein K6357_00645 [Elusimicrobiota bacterium]